jgi:hypothetical protein
MCFDNCYASRSNRVLGMDEEFARDARQAMATSRVLNKCEQSPYHLLFSLPNYSQASSPPQKL